MILDEKKVVVEETIKKEVKKKLELAATIKPHRGHTLFMVNKETGEIAKAEFEKQVISYSDAKNGKKQNRKVIIDENFIYISALNKKNVVKKLRRQIINQAVKNVR